MTVCQSNPKEQYLTIQEEKALVNYILRMTENGYPLLVMFVRTLALVIVRQGALISRFLVPRKVIPDRPGGTGHKAFPP